ncbi:MAG: hypothetical protein RL367_1284 [Pseudomonadota bacterium]|jgi:hypothetical protein
MDAITAIRNAKARYWRGVDLCDGELVRSVLAQDCELDYHGCCTDPVSGKDFLPAMNVTMKGRDSWVSDGLRQAGIISVHQGHQADIELIDAANATAIWAFTDLFFVPSGKPFSRLTGYGHYHETYQCQGGVWVIKTLRMTRIWVEVV